MCSPEHTVPAESDHDTPPERSRGLFPRSLVPHGRSMYLLGGSTHTVMMEKNRKLLFQAVQNFLEQGGPR